MCYASLVAITHDVGRLEPPVITDTTVFTYMAMVEVPYRDLGLGCYGYR